MCAHFLLREALQKSPRPPLPIEVQHNLQDPKGSARSATDELPVFVLGQSLLGLESATALLSEMRLAGPKRVMVDRTIFPEGAFEEPPSGVPALGALVEIEPERVAKLSHLLVGEALFRGGRVEEALAYFAHVVDHGSTGFERATAMSNTATIAYNLGDPESAAHLLRRALSTYPGLPAALENASAIAAAHPDDAVLRQRLEAPVGRRVCVGLEAPLSGWESAGPSELMALDFPKLLAELGLYDEGSLSEVFLFGMLERVSYAEAVQLVAAYQRALSPCGRLRVTVLDARSVFARLAEGGHPYVHEAHLLRLLHGGHGQQHASYTDTMLLGLLEGLGLADIRVEEGPPAEVSSSMHAVWGEHPQLHMSARKHG
jgi:tetratricopeptide (TPR) repeat protein